MRIGVIDLGTNTCNLLIAEIKDSGFEILHQSKQLVKLGDDKINANEISPEATKRTLAAFQVHKKITETFCVDKVKVIATSAIRTAENKIPYLEKIGEETGWIVKVVSGEKEAELIFEGVLLAFGKLNNPSVILDIGGGSNELIFAFQKELLWKESQPTGMARIINQFSISDPILPDEIETLQNYYSEQHKNAFQKCIENSVQFLVGCSGAFDTIADIIDVVNAGDKQRKTQEINLRDFYRIYNILVESKREDRLLLKGMDLVRVDLIVPAVILIECLISEIGINRIFQTDYALREGVLFEMMKLQVISS